MLTSPLFVVIGARLFLREAMTARKIVAVLVGMFGGLILLSEKGGLSLGASSSYFAGAALTVLASLSLALSAIATRKLAKSLDSANITLWSMALGWLLLSSSAALFETRSLSEIISAGTPSAWSALLFLSLVCSAFCFFIWNFAISKASPKEIASTMHLKTPTAVVLGAILAGEPITTTLVLGAIVVMCGVWISQSTSRKK